MTLTPSLLLPLIFPTVHHSLLDDVEHVCPHTELGPHAPQSEAGVWGPHYPLGAAPPLPAPQGPVHQETKQEEETGGGREGTGNPIQSERRGRGKEASDVRCKEKWKSRRDDEEMKMQQMR